MTEDRTATVIGHLAQGAEQVRQANHASYSASREVTDYYDAFGAVVELVGYLSQTLDHLGSVVEHAEPERYRHDHHGDVAAELATAAAALTAARHAVARMRTELNTAWSALGQLAFTENRGAL